MTLLFHPAVCTPTRRALRTLPGKTFGPPTKRVVEPRSNHSMPTHWHLHSYAAQKDQVHVDPTHSCSKQPLHNPGSKKWSPTFSLVASMMHTPKIYDGDGAGLPIVSAARSPEQSLFETQSILGLHPYATSEQDWVEGFSVTMRALHDEELRREEFAILRLMCCSPTLPKLFGRSLTSLRSGPYQSRLLACQAGAQDQQMQDWQSIRDNA